MDASEVLKQTDSTSGNSNLLFTLDKVIRGLSAASTGSDAAGLANQVNHSIDLLKRLRDCGLSSCIHPSAAEKISSSDAGSLTPLVNPGSVTTNCFVLSVDLRRSTDLMLKARPAASFATFIRDLTTELRSAIIDSYGIFDKFTGDGILAFFPDFMCRPNPGLRAVSSAYKCHSVFNDIYRENYDKFSTVILDTGLGIGLDYGECTIIEMNGQLTVVGEPVVYACRLSGAPAGSVYANHPAYRHLLSQNSEYLEFDERELDFKHEGRMRAYNIRLNERRPDLDEPNWD